MTFWIGYGAGCLTIVLILFLIGGYQQYKFRQELIRIHKRNGMD